jgi:hypothetical protein
MTTDRLLHFIDILKADPADFPNDPLMRAWVRGRNTALDSVAKQARLEEAVFVGIPDEALSRAQADELDRLDARALPVMDRAARASEVGDLAYERAEP